MGWFSGVKKIFAKAAPIIGTVIGGMYGNPQAGAAAGSAFGGLLGGNKQASKDPGETDWWGAAGSLASSAYEIYNSNKTRNDSYAMAMEGINNQNSAAALMAHQANIFSQQQAQDQMAFQERMASTQHQREVTDLRAAGLNPVLSGTGGMGNAAPSGAQGSVVTAPVADTGRAVTTAMEAMKSMADTQKLNATSRFISGAQTAQSMATAKQLGAATELTKEQTEHETQKRYQTQQTTTNAIAELDNIHARLAQIHAETTKAGATTNLSLAQADKVDQEKRNLMETFKTLRKNGDIDASDFGKYTEMAKRVSDVAGLKEIMDLIKSLKHK